MTYDQLSDEWKDWLSLPPLERFTRSERTLVEYIAMGGSLDPDPVLETKGESYRLQDAKRRRRRTD